MKTKTLSVFKLWKKSLVKFFMLKAPRSVTSKVVRRNLVVPFVPQSGLQVILAESAKDKAEARQLLYEVYVSCDYINRDSPMKDKEYDEESRSMFVAKVNGKTVGTISMIKEHQGCFPMEEAFDLSSFSGDRSKTAEVGSLAIDPMYRNTQGSILFPLFRAIVDASKHLLDINHLIITYNPKHEVLYDSMLMFNRIPGTNLVALASVNGAPALASELSLEAAPHLFRKAYGSKLTKSNLYRYIFTGENSCIQLPQYVSQIKSNHDKTIQEFAA